MPRHKSGLMPLNAEGLREKAKQAIRASITIGEIEPGRVYPVAYFAERLGVSATPVREALLDLVNEGLVESLRNRGYRVRVLSDTDLDEIFFLRVLLEVPSVGKIAERADPEDLPELRRLVAKFTEYASSGDLVSFLEADREFHLGLLALLGNTRLVETVGHLRDQTRLYGFPRLTHEQLLGAANEHQQILEAVEARDRARAEEQMHHHLEHTRGVWAGRDAAEGDLRLARERSGAAS